MHCPVCGNDQFSAIDDDLDNLSDAPDETRIQCSDCKTIFTKEELEENQATINANMEEVKNEAVKELEKELKKALKKLR